jgi:hypothetical protein
MPTYIYGCDIKEHPRCEVVHRFNETAIMECEVCGRYLHRIPQPFLWGVNPLSLIRDWSEANWSRKLRGEPRDYKNVSGYTKIPQGEYGARK